ncbi:hypothetical protein ACVWYH_009626 [Bradyrhizobium sp. GM24.11]
MTATIRPTRGSLSVTVVSLTTERILAKPRRIASLMADASLPSEYSDPAVSSVASAAIQSRIRPSGYHSTWSEAASEPAMPLAKGLPNKGLPSMARWPSHQAGSANARP